jgi:hypothetical protein
MIKAGLLNRDARRRQFVWLQRKPSDIGARRDEKRNLPCAARQFGPLEFRTWQAVERIGQLPSARTNRPVRRPYVHLPWNPAAQSGAQFYSYRRATIGSTRMARRAGM